MAATEWIVEKGDNIWDIAAKVHAMTYGREPTLAENVEAMQAIIAANLGQLKGGTPGPADLIRPGQKLAIPGWGGKPTPGQAITNGKKPPAAAGRKSNGPNGNGPNVNGPNGNGPEEDQQWGAGKPMGPRPPAQEGQRGYQGNGSQNLQWGAGRPMGPRPPMPGGERQYPRGNGPQPSYGPPAEWQRTGGDYGWVRRGPNSSPTGGREPGWGGERPSPAGPWRPFRSSYDTNPNGVPGTALAWGSDPALVEEGVRNQSREGQAIRRGQAARRGQGRPR